MSERGVAPVVGTILLVAIVVIIATVVAPFFFDLPGILTEPPEQRSFGDTEVVLGAEHRSWSGWNGLGEESRGDIDTVGLTYQHGPPFAGNETGAIEVSWDDGSVRFLNPARFDAQTGQKYHDGDAVGTFCTGDFEAGETLQIRMAHNKWQDGGETDQDAAIGDTSETFGLRYVESNSNDLSTASGDPFFRVEGRYPIEYSGSGIIEPGQEVTIRFFGPEGRFVVAETSATARLATGSPAEYSAPSC